MTNTPKKEWELEERKKFYAFWKTIFVHPKGDADSVKMQRAGTYWIDLIASRDEALIAGLEGMKFPSVEGGSSELPYTEYTTAKPAHESNEIYMQHAHNQALDEAIALIQGSREV